MSTMKVRGEAKYDFAVDQFTITFKIKATLQSSGEAIESGKKRTEQFLQTMNDELDLKPNDFIIDNFSVKQGYSASKYTYEKTIMLKMCSNLKAVEKIAVLMESMSDIEYAVAFEISDEPEKEQIVLQSAINDSKSKAEMIASSLGKKIIGIEDVNYEYTTGELNYDYSGERYLCKKISVDDENDLASQLKNPVKSIKKAINIIWIME
ncbi:MAG: SIMPL domain-containing protein [Oscillospiraceae bacterium]|nr:SIMPL domain-containing protein [Oscillospiraceae bacterium]